MKVSWHRGAACDPDSRDELGNYQLAIDVARDVVRTHLPGIKSTPDIVETCLYTVRQCLSRDYYHSFFAARRTCIAPCMVWPGVHLSDTGGCCVETAERIEMDFVTEATSGLYYTAFGISTSAQQYQVAS